ncbi:complement C5 [Alligator mississippiensis]|uniref:Complement C5 n=1 Tax=Alligator mississippiensis TaxID=8496 RepID=A0A151NUM2_ALLMI|nr:complement C5 [Alligator mississippiensis]
MARSPQLPPPGTAALRLGWSGRRGQLLVQTDKPIYTPRQRVHFRVFALDQSLRPTNEPVVISVLNSQGLQVRRVQRVPFNWVIADQLSIPDIAPPGTWRIIARFADALESNTSAEFEVMKYVLPNFEVRLVPDRSFLLVTDDSGSDLQINLHVRFTYGKGVTGAAFLRFGISDGTGGHVFIRGLEQQVTVTEGEASVMLRRALLVEKVGRPLRDLVGTRLYIAATVIETASGEMEEAELNSVRFVTSPWTVDLSGTERHFVPGAPFPVLARVTQADGSPAPRVPVRITAEVIGDASPPPLPQELVANEQGVVLHQLNLPARATALTVTVQAGTIHPAVTSLRAKVTEAQAGGFLLIQAPRDRPARPGTTVSVVLKDISPVAPSHFYYLIVSRGAIVSAHWVTRSYSTVISVPITHALVPAFRLVAYYHLNGQVVANAVWIDVEDSCEGKLELGVASQSEALRPHETLALSISTDTRASVSLVAVDSAVYILNSRNRLTSAKVFEALNGHDLGCSPGGGANTLGVFTDAGLALRAGDLHSTIRTGHGCSMDAPRKKRSLEFQRKLQEKAGRYQGDERLQRCCRDGLTAVPMRRSCEDRAARIPSSATRCRRAFLDCCTFATNLRRQNWRRRPPGLARAQAMEDENEFFDDDFLQPRSVFPESWLWKTLTVEGTSRQSFLVPDSITTWEIQAVSMSPRTGLCVSSPLRVPVTQDFHVSLRLPYSVRRFEQLQITPVLYNHGPEPLDVRVQLELEEGICAPSGGGQQQVQVPGQGALAVPFSLVPLGAADIPITVSARGQFGVGDSITRTLHVEREGAPCLEEMTYSLDSADGHLRSLEIPGQVPSNVLPDGDFKMSVRVTADEAGDVLESALSPEGLSRLLRVPHGCAEQTMFFMAPGLYAMRYLDETEQWDQLSPDRKEEGLQNLRTGYERILTFRKEDGSYGAWLTRPSSTWLTAFVVRVLALSRQYQPVDEVGLRGSVRWLLRHQQPDGSFNDPQPIIHREMQGGVVGPQAVVSLTAFVAVALRQALVLYAAQESSDELEAARLAELRQVRDSLALACRYLAGAGEGLSPYPAAITAYALSLASSDRDAIAAASARLRALVTTSQDGTQMFWAAQGEAQGISATAVTVEATAYALLHLLLQNDLTIAPKVTRWLTEQRNYGGGFKSTQDTVVALDALSQYWISTYKQEDNALDVTVSTPGRSGGKRILLDRTQNHIQEELKFPLGSNIHVKVEGKGKGSLTVLKQYSVLDLRNTSCQSLELDVTVTGAIDYEDMGDYEYNYDYGDEAPAADAPLHAIHWFDARRRRRRDAADRSQREKEVHYTICIQRKPGAPISGMAIADITLLSGFQPHTADLDKLKDLVDRYISHYEVQGQRLLLYFETVPEVRDCVGFRAQQTVPVGMLQPAAATLYDFYEPGRQCSVFYNAPSRSKFISALCSNDVCQCAEGACSRKKRTLDDKVTEAERTEFACYSPRVQYGYEVQVLREEDQSGFRAYVTKVLEPLQFTGDVGVQVGQSRWFLVRASCRLRLAPGRRYLLMGQDGETRDAQGQLRYLLEEGSWVEELPDDRRCEATAYRNLCAQLRAFKEAYGQNGCKV